MSKLILLCVETNPQSPTDEVYIRDTIDHFFVNDPKTLFRTVFLKGKTNYNSKSIVSKISGWRKRFSGEIIVIYFIDTDDSDVSPEDAKRLKSIRAYCETNNYELVLFVRDVEEVYLGHKVSDKEKMREAQRFRERKLIEKVRADYLSSADIRMHKSNILLVLEKYLIKKNVKRERNVKRDLCK